jgi:sugar (pentulose or hexulose) kinase
MTDELLVGVDLGTSTVKAVVTSTAGQELAYAGTPLRWRQVPTGAETTLAELHRLALAAVDQALARAPAGRVRGIGITGMAEAGCLLDDRGEPVAPVIAWHDARGASEAERLAADLGAARFSATTGLPLSATPTIMKLAWQRAHTDAFARARRWLGVPEAIAHGLGGAPVADLSLACRTGMLNLHQRSWWREAVDWLETPALVLGEPAASGTALGTVDSRAGLLAGLAGAVVTVAGHDHLTGAFGAGAVAPGDMLDSCGTAEALLLVAHSLSADAVSTAVADGFCVSWHVVPNLQVVIAAAPTGLYLGRVLDLLGRASADRDRLDRAAEQVADAPRLGGLALDDVSTAMDGGWRAEQVWRAAIDAAADELTGLADRIERHGGHRSRLIATGGWTRCRPLLSAKTERFGPVALPRLTEAGARGAALMAGVASGVYRSTRDVPPPQYTSAASFAPPLGHQAYAGVPRMKESSS